MSNVKFLSFEEAGDGYTIFRFEAPAYRTHQFPGKHVLVRVRSSSINNSDLDEIRGEAQGVYETWMQDIDKQHKVTVEETLEQRGSVHGDYNVQSSTHDALLAVMIKQPSFMQLKPQHRQALNIIAMKISRVLSGDAEHTDHWHDIAGYATLAEKACAFVDPNQQELDLGR